MKDPLDTLMDPLDALADDSPGADTWDYVRTSGNLRNAIALPARPAYDELLSTVANPKEFEDQMASSLYLASTLQMDTDSAFDLQTSLGRQLFKQPMSPSQMVTRAMSDEKMIDRAVQSWNSLVDWQRINEPPSWWQQRYNAFTRGVANVQSGMAGLSATVQGSRQPGYGPTYLTSEQRQAQAAKDKEDARTLWQVAHDPELASSSDDAAAKVLDLALETLPYVFATTAAYSTMGPAGGFTVGMSVEGNNGYQTAIDAGVPEDKANKIRVMVGLASGAIESFGGPAADKLMSLATEKITNRLIRGGADFAIGTLVEGLEEAGQELSAITGETSYRDVDWNEGLRRTLGSAAGGLMLGGMFKTSSAVMRGITNFRSPADQRRALRFLAAQGELTEDVVSDMEQTAKEQEAQNEEASKAAETPGQGTGAAPGMVDQATPAAPVVPNATPAAEEVTLPQEYQGEGLIEDFTPGREIQALRDSGDSMGAYEKAKEVRDQHMAWLERKEDARRKTEIGAVVVNDKGIRATVVDHTISPTYGATGLWPLVESSDGKRWVLDPVQRKNWKTVQGNVWQVPPAASAAEEVTDPYDYQDAHAEQVIHSGWGEGESYRHVLEGSGDIFRELAKPGGAMKGYIREKMRRIRSVLDDIQSGELHPRDTIAAAPKDKLDAFIAAYESQPVTTKEQDTARQLALALGRGDYIKAETLYAEMQSILSKKGEYPWEVAQSAFVGTPPAEEVTPTIRESQTVQPSGQRQAWEMNEAELRDYTSLSSGHTFLTFAKDGSDILADYDKYGKVGAERKWGVEGAVLRGESVPRAVLEEYASEKWAQDALTKLGPTGQPTAAQGTGAATTPGTTSTGAAPALPEGPVAMNFTQFANSKGYPSDFDVLDDGDLSPSGKVSNRGREAATQRQRERMAANRKAHEEYQAAIDAGEIVDPEGKYTKTPANKTPEAKQAQSRIVQLESQIKNWDRVGISGKTGKLRPKFANQIAEAKAEIERLRPVAEGQLPASGEIGPPAAPGESEGQDRGVSTAAQRVQEEAIAKDLTESLGELPTYEKMSMEDQARMASAEIDRDYENAKQMAYGKVAPPAGLRPASIYRAVAVKARNEGDVETLRNLAVVHPQISLELTAMGQAIKAADVGVMGDPVKAMRDIQKAKEAAAKKKGKGKDIKAEKAKWAKGAKEAIKTKTHHRQSWNDFVKEIQC